MGINIAASLKNAITFSHEEAIRLGNDYVGVEHIFLGIHRLGINKKIQNPGLSLLDRMRINLFELKQKVEEGIRKENKRPKDKNTSLPFNKQAERMLKLMYLEAKSLHNKEVNTDHALLAILKDENTHISSLLNGLGINYDKFKALVQGQSNAYYDIPSEKFYNSADDELLDDLPSVSYQKTNESEKSTATPVLDNFGRDLTRSAKQNLLDPIVGRYKELERVAQILSRRKKNNPILIGEPGVGKSAIAEGLAIKIANKEVPAALFDKRVVSLDIASIVAGTKYRGQFEERMKALINELEKNPNVIVFIDEIHTIVGAGNTSGSLDASNMLKPALARGEIQCIGATTLNEYRQNIEKDGALERRFQKVLVEPTSVEETLEILNNIKSRYESHHGVSYSKEVLRACVYYTDRYITDRFLPDKAIDAMDEAGASARISSDRVPKKVLDLHASIEKKKADILNNLHNTSFLKASAQKEELHKLQSELDKEKARWQANSLKNKLAIKEEDIASVVSMMSGVPVQKIAQDEMLRLADLDDKLKARVIGQDEAVKKIVSAIRRNRTGLKDPSKPIGNFIFLGPTGVGKTYLAKQLALLLFESDQALIRVDMSEYMEKFAVSRLIGAPPGYVGYEDGGQLTEKVRRKPYSIILFDEIEKAHPDVFNLLLQVLDEGFLSDSMGRKVDFKNTVIIMTSNIGSRQLKEFGQGVGFTTEARLAEKEKNNRKIVQGALKKHFAPEFLNRIDDVVIFHDLQKEDILKIIDIELKKVSDRLKKMNISLNITQQAKEFMIEDAWDADFGARPLKRAIQKHIEDILAEAIVFKQIESGQKVKIDFCKKEKIMKIKSVSRKKPSLA